MISSSPLEEVILPQSGTDYIMFRWNLVDRPGGLKIHLKCRINVLDFKIDRSLCTMYNVPFTRPRITKINSGVPYLCRDLSVIRLA